MLLRTRCAVWTAREECEDAHVALDCANQDLEGVRREHKRLCTDKASHERVRQMLANEGGKCAALAADGSIPLITLMHAALGKQRRITKRLAQKSAITIDLFQRRS